MVIDIFLLLITGPSPTIILLGKLSVMQNLTKIDVSFRMTLPLLYEALVFGRYF